MTNNPILELAHPKQEIDYNIHQLEELCKSFLQKGNAAFYERRYFSSHAYYKDALYHAGLLLSKTKLEPSYHHDYMFASLVVSGANLAENFVKLNAASKSIDVIKHVLTVLHEVVTNEALPDNVKSCCSRHIKKAISELLYYSDFADKTQNDVKKMVNESHQTVSTFLEKQQKIINEE